jgi:hypothetical protein
MSMHSMLLTLRWSMAVPANMILEKEHELQYTA